MDEANVSVLGVQRTLSHDRASNVNKRITQKYDPADTDAAAGFIYALRSYWKRYGVMRKPKPYELDLEYTSDVFPKESAVEFDGNRYHINMHNLSIITTPRRVIDKRIEPPEGLTTAQCRFYCAALDKNTFDDTLARRATAVALWVLEHLE